MAPSVFVFTLDCLRASTASASVTPFLRSFPLQWSRCFSSGTWTLPSHASLFSGQSPATHEVTRPGDSLSETDAVLTREANSEGYETAIFSENPTFSSQTGFGHHVDATHDDIHRKLLASTFSPHGHVDSVDPEDALSLASTILSRSNRVRNAINAVYATYLQLVDPDRTYPHNGERVLSHLRSYLSRRSGPTLTVTNILDPHNPYHGMPPGEEASRPLRELKALRSGDDNREFLLTDEEPPDAVQSAYGDWPAFFSAQEAVYEEYAAEADRLLAQWHDAQSDRFEEGLVVVLGDHGQLFGAEGMVGHHTSLHPNGVNVPFAVDPPSGWGSGERLIDTPVSIAGIGSTLVEVLAGTVRSTDQFIESVREHSRESEGAVIVCADGPAWSVSSLYEDDRYRESLVKRLAVRKVACVRDEYVDLYRSPWDSESVEASSFTYTRGARRTAADREVPDLPPDLQEWLTQTYELGAERRDSVGSRLEALGYV